MKKDRGTINWTDMRLPELVKLLRERRMEDTWPYFRAIFRKNI